MPSFFKHHARGVQKPMQKPMQKPIFHGFKPQSYLNYFVPQSWFFASPAPLAPAPEPVSTVFETNDCIWYHGVLYVKEAVAVAKMQEQQYQ